jgi:hypothetical protein
MIQVRSVSCDIGLAAAVLLLGAWGALQCFWPVRLRRLRDKLGRGYKVRWGTSWSALNLKNRV